MGTFGNNAKAMGLGYAFDCLFADIQYKCDVKSFEAESERIKKRIERRKKLEEEMKQQEEQEQEEDLFDDDVEDDDEDQENEEETAPAKKANGATKKIVVATKKKKKVTAKKEDEEDQEDDDDDEILALPGVIGAFSDKDVEENLKLAYKILSDVDQRKVKLTIIGLLYCACVINTDQLYKALDKTDVSDIEFMNALMDELSEVALNPSYATPKLETLMDKETLERIFDFESLYKELENNYMFQQLSDTIYKEVKKEDEATGEAKGPAIPIQFNVVAAPGTPDQAPKITNAEIKNLNKIFGDLLAGYQYQFNKIYDTYELAINRGGYPDCYTIDPGHIFGIGPCILFSVYGSIIPVKIESKEIVKRLLADKNNFFTITEEEKSELFKGLLPDFRIYYCVDMTRGKEIFDKVSAEQANKFTETLSKILNLPWGSDKLPMMPRLRIKRFANASNFDLVSDDKVKVVYLDGFNAYIKPMSITVYRDKLTIKSEGVDAEITLD